MNNYYFVKYRNNRCMVFLILSLAITLMPSCVNSQIPPKRECFLCCDSTAQVKGTLVRESEYEGIIFDSKSQLPILRKNAIKNYQKDTSWNPTIEEVYQVEILFKKYFNEDQKSAIEKKFNTKINLENYLRQYVGIYDTLGNKILLIGFHLFFDKDQFCRAYFKNYVQRFNRTADGKYYYMMVRYDVQNKKFYDFLVNS